MVNSGVQCKDSLELRSVLFARPYWTSRRTRTLIQAICGPNTNTSCAECEKTFTTHKRLRVHVRQHFTNTFCSCGVFSFQRDYILRHQRRSNCYSGGVFEVDRECFLEFRDLLLPHVTDQKQRKLILQGFPKTRPSVESGRDQSVPSPSSPSLSSLSTSSSLPRPRAIEPCTSKEPVPQAQHSISCSPSTSQLGCSEATDHKPTDSLDYDIEVKVSSLEKRLCRLSQDILHTNFELLRLNRLLRKRRAAAPESVPACS